ncbi:hypothetical protein NQ314_016687 [Rhamnusium bicolor]|uniref:DDE Tnp4 domain-containing protein n=1 Tax=Rhamnusium bicolor TaxID=1586634 RepID=A0AAV8WV27_9CUCU|nr:hypothetical protein NQ314_016687 [Rhamnusium bicolor]
MPSIILMALVDYEYCFTIVDVGTQGRMNDAGVYASTFIYRKMIRNELMLPPPEPFLGWHKPMPYVFVGDDAFPLSTTLMKPYPGNYESGSIDRIFNYRLCRARRIVENAFGILASVFRVFRSPILLQPEKAALVTLTCTLLHNFLRRSQTLRNKYTPNGTFDSEVDGNIIPGTWRQDTSMTSYYPLQKERQKSLSRGKRCSEKKFAQYFMTNGAVQWQSDVD